MKMPTVALVGSPNVGKSTIFNRLVGRKVAIIEDVPGITRDRIYGIGSYDDYKFNLIDTGGIDTSNETFNIDIKMQAEIAIDEADVVIFVVDGKMGLNANDFVVRDILFKSKKKVIVAINKIDMINDKEELFKRIVYLTSFYDFTAVVPVSATEGDHVDELIDELDKLAFESPHFFPDDTLTDQPERVLAAEIIREKILRLMDKEIPHGIAVAVEKMRERDDKDILDIDATIYCERESHKGMVIGKNGSMLKKVSAYARQDLERFFQIKVNLHCWVKVKEDWRNREGLIHNFGLDNK